ncbi:acyl-CoA dehydrogenase family protein [Desulfobacula sp.]|uniref:acyl-CoA dehydrogenase family protein n=1 Tax=Desulfobacula sp. TaxID=2593537 RepID=UPI0026169472|nr:acyl-CoA dehydrogenase family protein [Desulfobacula sp.]
MTEKRLPLGGEFLITETAPHNIFIPEDFTKLHKMIHAATTDFVQKEVFPNTEQIETKDEAISRELLLKTGELGLNGTDIPEIYGGEEMDKISTCLVTEAMGAAGSFSITHSIHTGIGSLPIVYFGTEDQKKKYLPKLCSGDWVGAYCLTEPGAGSDALNSLTTAVLSEDGKNYILNGEKIYITNGSWADCYTVYAKVDGEKFTGFIVEKAFAGIERGAEEKKMGLTGSSTCTILLKDCIVPVENVLYEIGKGHKIAFNILNMGRYKIGANAVGGSKTAISDAAKHAATRIQFGQPIGSFGMVRNKLADMVIRTYMTESMIYRLAFMIDSRLENQGEKKERPARDTANVIEEYAVECSMIKVYGSECLDFCVDEWVQILGGAGLIADYPAERAYRGSRINRIVEGTNEINRLLVPQTLFKRSLQGRLNLKAAVEAVTKELNSWETSRNDMADEPLALEEYMVRMCKKMILLAFGVTVQKLGKSFLNEQSVLGILADMSIEVFAMESGLLRAIKIIEKNGIKKAEYHIAAVKTYVGETLHKMEFWANQILVFSDPEETLNKYLDDIKKLSSCHPIPTIVLKEKIAERVIKLKKYIF